MRGKENEEKHSFMQIYMKMKGYEHLDFVGDIDDVYVRRSCDYCVKPTPKPAK